jgi:hypothetical protein
MFVEAHRYVLFDGYENSAHPAYELVVRQGVMVDNLVYKVTLPDGYEAVRDAKGDTITTTYVYAAYVACYSALLGRYSISPALFVLSLLMANLSQDMFSNAGDVFERAIAQLLFLTAQIFHGRPAEELVAFFIGTGAVVGSHSAESRALSDCVVPAARAADQRVCQHGSQAGR